MPPRVRVPKFVLCEGVLEITISEIHSRPCISKFKHYKTLKRCSKLNCSKCNLSEFQTAVSDVWSCKSIQHLCLNVKQIQKKIGNFRGFLVNLKNFSSTLAKTFPKGSKIRDLVHRGGGHYMEWPKTRHGASIHALPTFCNPWIHCVFKPSFENLCSFLSNFVENVAIKVFGCYLMLFR
jgi:hypothetical protein